jgi:hypothetical protein
MKRLIEILKESTVDKSSMHHLISHPDYTRHDENIMHDHKKPFDEKFSGDTDEVGFMHKRLKDVHTLKHIIANHVGDKTGAILHKKAAKLHDIAHKSIENYDDIGSWNRTQARHENAMIASLHANKHDE